MSISGSIESVSIAGRIFAVIADADASIKLGNKEAEDMPTGSGGAIKKIVRVPWSVTGLAVEIDNNRDDLTFLTNLVGEENKPVTVTLADGNTWQGTGGPRGEIAYSTQNGTATLALGGPGELELQ